MHDMRAAGDGPDLSDDALTRSMVEELLRRLQQRLDGQPGEALAHPLETDALLQFYMERIEGAANAQRANADKSRLGKAKTAARELLADDAPDVERSLRIQDALIHTLHQLDHRTKFNARWLLETERKLNRRTVTPSGSTVGRRLAIVKPDWGSSGGFERHADRLASELTKFGWEPDLVTVDGHTRPSSLFGLPVMPNMLLRHDDFFLYIALLERVSDLDLSAFDVVLTTQPPTFLVEHPRRVALFYHQARQFYDLAREYAESGFVEQSLHELAAEGLQRIERTQVPSVGRWLAGSNEVEQRLRTFWQIPSDRIEIHRTTPPEDLPRTAPSYTPEGPVVTVGRHEWPKRVELSIAAIHASSQTRPLIVVGSGSRLEFARSLDSELGAAADDAAPTDSAALVDAHLWLNSGAAQANWKPSVLAPSGRVDFRTQASNAERDHLYSSASVVVCPAYREDHGHTPLEAMAHGRPVVVCSDGGGLTEFVEHGVTGLVVDPTPQAIGEAIDYLVDNPKVAEEFGQRGREKVAAMSWHQSAQSVDEALRGSLDSI